MPTNDPLNDLAAAESDDKATAEQIVGEHAVTQEQEAYGRQIAAAPTPPIAPPIPADKASGPDMDSPEGLEAAGTTSAVAGAYHGVVHAVTEMASSVYHLSRIDQPSLLWQKIAQNSPDAGIRATAQAQADRQTNISLSMRAGADAITPEMSDGIRSAASGITQTVAAFLPISKAMQAEQAVGAMARIATNGVAFGASQAAAFDPHGERMSNLVESFPALSNPLNAYLASRPGDSDADGVLKNFLEGTIGGVVGDGVVEGALHIFRGARAAVSLAANTKGLAEAESTSVTHVSPQPGPVAATLEEAADGTEVHTREMTDEEFAQFQGLRSHVQADEDLSGAGGGKPRQQGSADDGAQGSDTEHPQEGQPHVVYRGSQAELEDSHFADHALGHNSDHPSSGLGVFFTSSKEDAAGYGPLVSEHHLDIRNPKVLTADTMPSFDSLHDAVRYREELKRKGYDGITYDTSELGGPVQHIAFEPSQVRDAKTMEASVPPSAEPKPYEPPQVTQADTAHPSQTEQPVATASSPSIFKTGTVDTLADADKLSPPTAGFTRLFRAESPTKGAKDAFNLDDLKGHDSPLPGKYHTDDAYAAFYYKGKYGKDAKVSYTDVPTESLAGKKVAEGEYKVTQSDLGHIAEQPQPVTEATLDKPQPVFDPKRVAMQGMRLDPTRSSEFMKAVQEGRYNDIPGVLDDTHRTMPWDTLSDGANLKGLFNAMEDHFGAAIKAAHGTTSISDSTMVQLAKDIGGDVSSLQRTFGNLTDNGGLAAQIISGYNIMTASARQLKDLAEIARPLDVASPEGAQAIINFQKQLELHAAIVGQVRQNSAEVGRALYAHRTLKASSDVELSNLSELAGTVLGPKAVKKFIKSVGGDDTLAGVNAAADVARGKGFFGVVKEVAQGGMLSGWPTQIANLGGNVSKFLIQTGERFLAGTIGDVRGVLMPTAEHASIRSAIAATAGIADGVRDSFPLMVKALTKEQDVSAAGRPLTKAIYRDPTGQTGANLAFSQVINITGQAVRYPGRLMGAVDNLNMGIGRQADLGARIYTQAATEADAKGLRGDARGTFMDSRMSELRAAPPTNLTDQADIAGLYQSFQEPARTWAGDKISDLLNGHPVVKLIVAPFVHRPLNMLRQSISDYTALGLLSRKMWADQLLPGGQNMDTAIARMTIGTGAIMASYELAANGKSVGMRQPGANTQNLDQIPQHSVNIGGNWYKYDRLDPVGMWLAIGADLHEAISRYHDPLNPNADAPLATMARMGIQVIGMSAMDKSFMKSIDQVTQAMGQKNPVEATKLFQNLVSGNAAKFVPFSGALRGVAQAVDPTQRTVGGDGIDNIWDAVKKGIPFASLDLPPSRDVLGRPKINPAGSTAWWNPFAGAPASADPMDQELSKLAVAIKTPPRTLQGQVLDSHQYDTILTNATQTKLFNGHTMNLQDYLRQVTSSDRWKKYETSDDKGVTDKTRIVQSLVDEAYNYGGDKFMQDNKSFRDLALQRAMVVKSHYTAGPGNVPTPVGQPAPVALPYGQQPSATQ